MNTFDLRPRTVGEVLDGAIKLYVRNARTLIGIVAVVSVPLQIVSGIVLLSVLTKGAQVPGNLFAFHVQQSQNGTTSSASVNGAVEIVRLVISGVTGMLCTAACVRAVSDAYADRPPSIAGSLRVAVRRLPILIVMEIVRYAGLILAFIALIIPGVWLYGAWGVATPALLVEELGPLKALGRSRRLVRRRWWPVAAVLLLSGILAAVVGSALQALFGAIDGFSSHPPLLLGVLAVVLGATVTSILVQPFTAAVTTVLYFDLRVRHEGYDVQVLADQLGLPAPPPGMEPAWRAGEPLGPDSVGRTGGPPFWPPPPGWSPPHGASPRDPSAPDEVP
jgi:hypothetical protein